MKRITFLLLFFPILALAQISVTEKSVKIFEAGPAMWPDILQRSITDADTLYTLTFRNLSYREIIDLKHIELTKASLKEFGKALGMVLKASLKEEIWVNHIELSKQKGPFGGTVFQIYYEHGFGSLKEKDINKLIEVILKE